MSEISKKLFNLSINELIKGLNDNKICFIVPSYQRGYRWSKTQIERLLVDLYEFQNEKDHGNKDVRLVDRVGWKPRKH